MLTVQINSKRKVYVELTPDTAPNKGGFFCQLYWDTDKEFHIDDFVIRKEQIAGGGIKTAMLYANKKVKDMFR